MIVPHSNPIAERPTTERVVGHLWLLALAGLLAVPFLLAILAG